MVFKYTEHNFGSFDDYFSLLEKSKNKLSKNLIDFFCTVDHYDLNHEFTLHDAWLLNTRLEKFYEQREDGSAINLVSQMKLTLELLLQTHKKIDLSSLNHTSSLCNCSNWLGDK